MSAIFLESKRLWFRAREESDAAFFTEALQNPLVKKHLQVGRFPFNEEGERKFLAGSSIPPIIDAATDVALVFGIKGEDAQLGATGLHKISWLHRNAEWGIGIGRPDEWGKGYGREVARAMLNYGFNTLNLHRIYLRVYAANMGGVKAYEAAGFKREGIAREAVFLDGEYVDQLIMAVLAHEFDAAAK